KGLSKRKRPAMKAGRNHISGYCLILNRSKDSNYSLFLQAHNPATTNPTTKQPSDILSVTVTPSSLSSSRGNMAINNTRTPNNAIDSRICKVIKLDDYCTLCY